jgi:hypothetical protein
VAPQGTGADVYAIDTIPAGKTGRLMADDTRGLDHWPMQATLGLSIASVAALRLPGWRVATGTSAVSAVWLGAMSIAYPEHVSSVGTTGGAACFGWGLPW